jgi:serine/threonine protein kinase
MLQPEQILQERYQLQERLGRTAPGRQTWLARDLQSNEQVIVKLLAFSPQMQWDELKLFEREAQVLANLNHPRIPRYRNYFSLDRQIGEGLPWFGIVQDYIPGASLQELLEQGKRFSEKQVKNIATQVLDILIYLHSLNPPVLHRDIKPSNLILAEDEQVYLVDFGAVQDKAAFTGVTFTVVGTSGYSPLEQFWGRAVPASDLYALGATLIHLLTGIAPADLPQKDSRIQFSDRITLNPSFVSWIEKLTEIAIERRFSNAKQALQALKSGIVQSSPTSDSRTLRKIPKPNGTRIAINKSAERLEIHIPAGGIRKIGRYNGLFLIGVFLITGFLSFMPGLYLLSLSQNGSFNLGLSFGLFFWGIATFFQLAKVCGEQTNICFDRHLFKLKRQTFNFVYGKQAEDITKIVGVFLISDGYLKEVSIRSATRTYQFGGALTEIECVWLAQEIQDWLNLNG